MSLCQADNIVSIIAVKFVFEICICKICSCPRYITITLIACFCICEMSCSIVLISKVGCLVCAFEILIALFEIRCSCTNYFINVT